MLSRRVISAAAPIAKNAFGLNCRATTVIIRRQDHHGPPANYKFPSMDELPVPCGSWKEHYDNQQRKYNIQLLLGVGFFIITFISCIASGHFNLYLMLPDEPAPRK